MKKFILFLAFCLSLYIPSSVAQIQGNWKDVGPIVFPINASGQIHGIGRVTQMKFHPSNSLKMYATTATGGLFISIDGGNNWTPTGTDNLFRTGCASVCIDYTNDQVLYLGTGDPNYYSNHYGIYKSTNGGQTWSAANSSIGNRMAVDILMSPSNNNVLIAATSDGIWKTTDGGASWSLKKSGGDFTQMIFKPNDANTIYAATHTQFFVSTNQGDSWTQISLPGSGFQNGGRIGVSKADPNVVYVTFVGSFSGGTATPVLKSTNSGQSFSVVKAAGGTNLNGYDGSSSGQGNYNYAITVDPNSINTVYIVGHVVWKSTDGGANWTQLTNWWQKVHTDMHQISISPYDNSKIYDMNDGGVWLSTDGGNNWNPKSDGLACTECYHAAQSPIRKDMIDIGTQDNGELNYTNNTWYTNGGGDFAGNIAFDYQNNTDVYHLGNDRNRKRLSGSGSAPSLNFPFAAGDGNGNDVRIDFNASQTNLAFVGKSEVYRSTNVSANPPTWTQITSINTQVQAIESSPADANVLYIVTNNNKLYRSDNALAASPTFTSYNTPGSTSAKASIAAVKSNSSVVYLTCGSKVYRSADKGANWSDVSGSIPSVNIIQIYNDVYTTDESVYIGMATGVYYKNNSMSDWVNYSKGLPTIATINEFMMFNDGTNNSEIRVAYYGRGVWGSNLYGKSALRDPENPPITVNGVDYKYYEGTWNSLPDFNTLLPVKTGTTSAFTLDPRSRDTQFGLRLTGYVYVPTDGNYTFYTSSDDGSKLYIGSTLVVNNDGIHGMTEQSGTIGLKAGKHAITVDVFQNAGGLGLDVSYSGPGISKAIIPNSVLFRIPPPTVCANTGTITRDYWGNIGGNEVSLIPVTTTPTSTTTLTSFEAPTNVADSYGQRVRGYICAPYTGAYTFWIASDDNSELWLSTSTNPSAKVKIAYLNGAVSVRNWTANPSQQSATINLVAGQQYYIEALQKEGVGDDNLAVGWQLPTGAMERPIPGERLSPYVPVNTPPTVSITAPTNNAVFYATDNITFTVNATDSDGNVTKVDFYNGSNLIGTSTTSPYSFTWNNVTAGTYTISAVATDNQGATGTSSAVNITVSPLRTPENPSGTVNGIVYNYYESASSWTALPDFTTLTPVKTGVTGVVDISVRNRDSNYGLTFKGYINVPTDGIYTFYTTSDDGTSLYIGTTQVVLNDGVHGDVEKSGKIGLKAGKHAFSVNYFQGVGGQSLSASYQGPGINKQTIPATMLYNVNALPIVSITAPANNATFIATSTITLTASASDPDGSIAKVDFYNGTTLIGTVTSSPYSFNWTNVAAGSYSLTAKATDNQGGVTTSSIVNITVTPLRTPENPSSTTAGVLYSYYEGSYNSLPNFSTLTPVKTGNISTFDISVRNRDDQFAFKYTGYINVPTDGIYTFYTTSDDGSALYIGSTLVVNNDGLHGSSEKNGVIGLKAGKHAITVTFFEQGGDQVLTVSYEGPAITKQTVPASVLFNANASPTIAITSPANNASFTAPASIAIAASAQDSDGSIAKVEFYNGSTLLGTSTSSPYSYTWTGVAAGNYTLTTKAYDNAGATASASVAVNVNSATNVNPTVSITAPANNSSYTAPASISISANASDSDGSISKVEFYNGSTLLGTSTTAPYTYTWTNVAAGTYSIVAKAYDNLNATATATVSVSVQSVNKAPTIAITSPANNSTFSAPATISITTTASDADGSISKVEFYNGGVLLGTLTSSPYNFSWPNVPAGNYTIIAKAYDNQNATASASVNVQVQTPNQLPTVSITAPSNNATFTAPASITISASASDSDGSITKVEFYNGSTLLGSSTSTPYGYSWSNVSAGTYTITAKAYDNSGATATTSVSVTVKNPNVAPTVSITSPANNSSFTAPASITISANASDSDGSITKVEFYNGSTLLTTDTGSPYSYTWSNVAAAPYTITAKAYDNSGAVASASVNITVNAANACAGLSDYVENGGYVAGSVVKNVGNKYQCKPWPYSGWCNGAAWAYGPGTGMYWTDAWDLVGSCNTPAMQGASSDMATETVVEAAAYPNPFENRTTVQFELKNNGPVTVTLYNTQGDKVAELYNGSMNAGKQTIDYTNTQAIADGTYICKIQTDDGIQTIHLVKVSRPRAMKQ